MKESLEGKTNTHISAAQKDYINSRVNNIDSKIKEKFESLYNKWLADCYSKMSMSSNTHDYAKVSSYSELVNLGKVTLPLYIEKLLNPEEFIALVPYEAVQNDSSYLVTYSENDPCLFEGEQARAIKTVNLWLEHEYQ